MLVSAASVQQVDKLAIDGVVGVDLELFYPPQVRISAKTMLVYDRGHQPHKQAAKF